MNRHPHRPRGVDIVVCFVVIVGIDTLVNKIVTPRDGILPNIKFPPVNENVRIAINNGWETRRSKVE